MAAADAGAAAAAAPAAPQDAAAAAAAAAALAKQLNATALKLAGANVTTGNLTAVGFIDVEEDRIAPGYAVLLMYLMLFMILGAQTGLVLWRKRHKRSYDLVSLAGLWLMPAVIALHLRFWRFLLVWAAYSLVTGYVLSLAAAGRRMHHTTPRKVYGWFLGAHRVSVGVGLAGYVLLVLDMFGVGLLLARLVEPGLSLMLLWYGLYFGILGRDLAEVASEQMANSIGGGRRLTSTVHACGLCGGELRDLSAVTGQQEADDGVEPVRQLACKHSFHDLCIRGWTIVGKKDVCPVCLEKVDMRELCADKPWETQNLSWIQMLDAVRYMIVWNPLIFAAFAALARLFPHHHVTRHIAVAAGAVGRGPHPAAAGVVAAAAGAPPPPPLLDAADVGAVAGGAHHRLLLL